MFGHLKKFLKGNYSGPASGAGKVLDEIHIELMALPDLAKDFTTPEGAILCLEDAYRRQDIEAAVAARDFKAEAQLLIEKSGFKNYSRDEIIPEMAKVVELSFRKHTTACWPDFDGLESFFPEKTEISEGIVTVTEVCRFPDGFFSLEKILVTKTTDGWRVLHVIKSEELPGKASE